VYDEDSHETSIVSPRGHVKAGEEAKYTTKTERDAQGRALTVTDALGNTTKYVYDADGNLESVTDGNAHTTSYEYDADNQRTKVKEADGNTLETGYDGAGQVVSQTDGAKHTTKYARNVLEQVTEVIDPLNRKTVKEYDAAGNLKKLTDPQKRLTSYTYDADNRLTEQSYSDGKTAAVKYEYDADGERTRMIDGTGTTSYHYDQLDRPAETTDGHGDTVSYEYDLANEPTKLTYPNGKAVTRKYDSAGRLEAVTDWLEHTTHFGYDSDSEQTSTTYPSGASNEDLYSYNHADQLTGLEAKKGSEVLASIAYGRDGDGQVKTETQKGLPGEEKPAVKYDEANRLTKGGTTEYKYDAANNPTKLGSSEGKYDSADELEGLGTSTYRYDEEGERTKASPPIAASTQYGYDQAGNLTTVYREKDLTAKPAIEDSYAYDGTGLRASQTLNGTTTYLTWGSAGGLPLLLNDGANSYIYGPAGLPVEQINNSSGAVTYLHHDQAGSTRLLTGSTGAPAGKCTYGAYGTPSCEGTATTPIGYDAQYTSPDTGLVYMRNRVYDPATAQFLTVDPLEQLTREPYSYVEDNPLNAVDPTGLCSVGSISGFLDCFNPVSSGNLASKGATGLSEATGGAINLPKVLTQPAALAIGAAAICAVPYLDAGCLTAIGVVSTVSTSSVVATGIETNFCNPARLAGEEAVTALLAGSGALGVYATGAASAAGAPGYARAIIRGGPALLEALLNGPPAAQGG
jgi:RHS repeat-associated protein